MFTDAIEAKYKEDQSEGLCSVSEYLYDSVAKVAIFDKRKANLQQMFNQWFLNQLIAS